jgi:precorrin-6B methylase 1
VNGLQKGIDQVAKYCMEWNLKKTKVLVCERGGKLKEDERWFMNGERIETVKEICYQDVALESIGGWAKQKAKW